jgi:beta-glucosidase
MDRIQNFLPFPPHFKFGTSISSFQVEGKSGIRNSDWDVFLAKHPDIIKPHEVGPQWWMNGKAEEDIDRLADLSMQVQRLSFEWARIEPEEGRINHEAIKRYREIINHFHKKKITPMVTLNHYTLPQWIGNWENPKIVSAFEKYVSIVSKEFGDITTWLTLNEPGILVEIAYLLPIFPPQHVGISSALTARKHMIQAHNRAYAVLKKNIPNASVSISFSFRWYRPENPKDIFETTYADYVDYLDNLNYIDAVKDTIDFIGCNYYAGYFLNLNLIRLKYHFRLHRLTAVPPRTILFGEIRKPGAYMSDVGAPIVPGFFLELLRSLWKRYHKPIIITENGIADHRDYHRAFYLLTHLVAVWRVMQEGVDVRQYLMWSSVDNLEWTEGYRGEFGLIHVDAVTGERTIRKSAYLYKDIIQAKGIAIDELLTKYLAGEQQENAKELIHHLLKKHNNNTLREMIKVAEQKQ